MPAADAGGSRVICVVLDPALEAGDPARFAALFEGFAAGYARHFVGDEAEPTGEWRARIAGKPPPQPAMRIVVAVEEANGGERVIGGVAAEYYRASGCVLVTYLYVSDAGTHGHRGHARRLLAEAVRACKSLGPVHAMLAEAEWPELLQANGFPAGEVATARTRLRFFARIGARMLDFDYLQPPLAPGKKAVPYLRLFVVPHGRDGDGTPGSPEGLREAVSGFLAEFYAALAEDTGVPADSAALARLQGQVAAARPLTSPLPRLRLDDVAVSFHFVEPLDNSSASTALLDAMKE